MSEFKSLIVVGPVGGGKSTAVEHLRGPGFLKKVFVPIRLSSRAHRDGVDNTLEHISFDREELEADIAEGKVHPYWQKVADIGKKPDIYGFFPPADDEDRLVVYSANNWILRDENPTAVEVVRNSLIVVVSAKHEVRKKRLVKRLGNSGLVEELMKRYSRDDDLIRYGGPGIIKDIDTSNPDNPLHGQQQMTSLLEEEFGIVPEPGLAFEPSDNVDSDSSIAK